MLAGQEFKRYVHTTTLPNKSEIVRSRRLAREVAQSIPDQAEASRVYDELNSAFLNLQMATVADDAHLVSRYRKECDFLVEEAESNLAGWRPVDQNRHKS